jgi:hypothetical protein
MFLAKSTSGNQKIKRMREIRPNHCATMMHFSSQFEQNQGMANTLNEDLKYFG